MSLRILDETTAQPFAFKRSDHIAEGQLQTLNLIHDRLAKTLSASLSATLRTTVEVSLMETVQVSYADFAANAMNSSCCAALTMQPLDGIAVAEIRPDVALAIVDRLLGGEGRSVADERPLTDIEKSILQSPLRMLAADLRAAWQRTSAIDFTIASTETGIGAIRGVAQSEVVIGVEFRFRMNAEDSRMRLALPASAIEPLFNTSGEEARGSRKIQQDENLIRQVRRIPVNISIETPETLFPLKSVVSLQPGDTLLLDQRDEWPLLLKVAGKTKMQAQTRKDTRRKAFTIIARNRAGIEDYHEFSSTR